MSSEKMTASSAAEEQVETPRSVEDQDRLLFASMNSDIADALAERVRVAIVDGVENLPLLTDAAKADALVKRIEKSYMLNIDLIEAYGGRNIFSLRNYNPRRRQRIIQAFLGQDEAPVQESNEKNKSQSDDFEVTIENTRPYPSKEEIPSPEDTSALQDELVKLKERLDAERLRRNQLLAKQKSLEKAIEISKDAVQSLVVSSESNVHGPVSKAVSGGKSIQELTKEGKELIKELDETKRDRSDDENEDHGMATTQFQVTKKKRQSLEEEYRADRMVLGANNSLQSLQALQTLLKKEQN